MGFGERGDTNAAVLVYAKHSLIKSSATLAGTGQCRAAADHQAGSLLAFENGERIGRLPIEKLTQTHVPLRVTTNAEKNNGAAGVPRPETREICTIRARSGGTKGVKRW